MLNGSKDMVGWGSSRGTNGGDMAGNVASCETDGYMVEGQESAGLQLSRDITRDMGIIVGAG